MLVSKSHSCLWQSTMRWEETIVSEVAIFCLSSRTVFTRKPSHQPKWHQISRQFKLYQCIRYKLLKSTQALSRHSKCLSKVLPRISHLEKNKTRFEEPSSQAGYLRSRMSWLKTMKTWCLRLKTLSHKFHRHWEEIKISSRVTLFQSCFWCKQKRHRSKARLMMTKYFSLARIKMKSNLTSLRSLHPHAN